MPSRNLTGSTLVTSSPLTVNVPEVGSIIRLIIRIEVVLPQPDGPTNAASVPSGTSRVRSSTATVPSGYTLRTASNLIIFLPVPSALRASAHRRTLLFAQALIAALACYRLVESVVLNPLPRGLVGIDT